MMSKISWLAVGGTLLAGSVLALSADATAKEKVKDSVTYAKTWEAAVEEARMLNVPIVVHSHGFYCGPCWGVHSAVLLNSKYIKFADQNTVEVIALGRLQEGIDEGDRKAATYEARLPNGDTVEYLVEFPGMTTDEMLALSTSKAATYNDTGKIPFTAIVDPYTEEEIRRYAGGLAASTLMDDVKDVRKDLVKEHGKGISRKDLRSVAEAEDDARAEVAEGDFSKALKALSKVSGKQDWPQELQDRVNRCQAEVMDAAESRFGELEDLAESDPRAAKRDLNKLASALRGTELADRAKELAATL